MPSEGAKVEIGIDRDKNGTFDEDEILTLPAPAIEAQYFQSLRPGRRPRFQDDAPGLGTRDEHQDSRRVGRARLPGRSLLSPQQPGPLRRRSRRSRTLMFDNTPPESIEFGEFYLRFLPRAKRCRCASRRPTPNRAS